MELASIREQYLRAQVAGHRREAVSLVESCLDHGASVEELQTEVIRAAQDELGRLWQLNMVSIAQEHMASEISNVALSALFARAPIAEPNGKKILLGCVEGEEHQLAARLASDMLEMSGFELRFLGGNVPHGHLVSIARDEKPDLIGLSVTMLFNLRSLREAVALLRTVTDAPICVGGYAIMWSRPVEQELQVHASGPSRHEIVALARRLTGLPQIDETNAAHSVH
jgi:methanogenic corrinoid protein MtbC1